MKEIIFILLKIIFLIFLIDKYQIENDIEFTNKMSFLLEINNWEKIEKGLREEEYKSYENKIEKEILDLEIIKEFSCLEKNYIEYQQILSEQLEEIKNKLMLKRRITNSKKLKLI